MPPNPTDTTNHKHERSGDVSRRNIAGKDGHLYEPLDPNLRIPRRGGPMRRDH